MDDYTVDHEMPPACNAKKIKKNIKKSKMKH